MASQLSAHAEVAGEVSRIVDEAFADSTIGQTFALLVLVDGNAIVERYGSGASDSTTLISWSMAKSITHALVGLLKSDGRLDPEDLAPIPEWQSDDRRSITLQHLLNMTSGLLFNEDYVDASTSHCIEMLFGSGQNDVAGYASALPLEHEPGSIFNYSSGSTNIVCRIAGDLVGDGEQGMRAYLSDRLFLPLGMTSAVPRFDAAGTFIGSSFVYATAREFAAFGELYRNDGVVGGARILPVGWVRHATTRTPAQETEDAYGAHWWLWPEYGGFGAHGYEGQRTIVVPNRRLTLVRLGKTPEADRPAMLGYLRRIIEAIPVVA